MASITRLRNSPHFLRLLNDCSCMIRLRLTLPAAFSLCRRSRRYLCFGGIIVSRISRVHNFAGIFWRATWARCNTILSAISPIRCSNPDERCTCCRSLCILLVFRARARSSLVRIRILGLVIAVTIIDFTESALIIRHFYKPTILNPFIEKLETIVGSWNQLM